MRMIDADALYDQVLMMVLFDNQDRDIFLDAIDEQPTAYDVDKVVMDLEYASYFRPPIYRATDIAKRGEE